MNSILLFVCVASILTGSYGNGTIFSTGEYENPLFEWAAGVPSLEFNYSSKCRYYHNWFIGDTPLTNIDTYGCYKGSQNIFNVSVTCNNKTSSMLSSTLTVYGLNIGNWSLTVKEGVEEDCTTTKVVHISYCSNLTSNQGDTLEVENGESASYSVVATFRCNTTASHKLYSETYIDDDVYQVFCKADGSWNETDEVQCHLAPNPKISLYQDGKTISNGEVVSEGNLTLNCCCGEEGYPHVIRKNYYLNGTAKQPTFKVLPIHYGSNVSCQAVNQFVDEVDSSSGNSSQMPLNVIFEPQWNHEGQENKEFANLNKTFLIVFNFTANPELNESHVNLEFGGKRIESNNTLDVEGIHHSFSHFISSITEDDFGTYTLITASPDYRIKNRVKNFSVILICPQIKPTTGPDVLPEEALIGICVAAAVVLIILIGFLIWRIRKRHFQKSQTAKEERDNPLYGTSPNSDSQAEYAAVDKTKKKPLKQEKANPLYQTSGTNAAGIEEAYGTVDQCERGTDNSAFSSETIEVAYAAVNKPKKEKPKTLEEAVYSAVDKKKKKKGILKP